MTTRKAKGSKQIQRDVEEMTTEKAKGAEALFSNGWDARESFEQLAGAGRENFDALVKASTIATKGYGAIGQQWIEFSRAAMEKNAQAAKAMMGAKTPKDLVEAQSDWAKTAFEGYVAETSKASELALKTTTEAFAPLQARVDDFVTKFVKPVA